MNTDTQLNPGSTNEPAFDDPDFISIDDPNLKWPTFILSMLKTARIMTAKEPCRHASAIEISAYMNRHKKEIPRVYNGKDIRDLFGYHGRYLSGGGVRIEGEQLEYGTYRTRPNYRFTLTRLIPPQDQHAQVQPTAESHEN